jgi:hypothetical protein
MAEPGGDTYTMMEGVYVVSELLFTNKISTPVFVGNKTVQIQTYHVENTAKVEM